ncbi:uncharacterized protein PADG_11074 [Paracoccidioides brasiliensis Pb18]|uniref:Retrotransposon gag domain-containing protein n=1 Tax=Paracoccidioides brasiliensis (strain Pb18) TaxID=502780 RepID=A0A0A0HTV6_PARBD|nr:uncharacterized protein PADG_11074 [Paracoccidioides brasiliensis Pb18]KGM92624.1 hypothetical protein PADG_11074 [Paracoccidioides brasiliensis Pb18]
MYDNERLSIRGIPESDKTRIYRLDPGIGEQHSYIKPGDLPDPPKFGGGRKCEAALNWLSQMESHFRLERELAGKKPNKLQQVFQASSFLKGKVKALWMATEQMNMETPDKHSLPETWNDFSRWILMNFEEMDARLGIFTVRLNGDALAKFQPWIDTCIEEQRTPENVFHQLDVLFLDPTHQAKALDWLNRNRQKNTALANYLPEFDRNLLEAGGQNWDIIQINMLSRNLNFELLNQSVGRQKLTTYSEYCANLRQLENDLAQFCTVQGCCNQTVPFSPPPTTTAPDPMDWAPHVSAGRPRISNISRKDVTDRIT